MTDQFHESGHASGNLTSRESLGPLRGLYAQVCQLKVLERAHAEVIRHLHTTGIEDLYAQDLKSFLGKLSSDLKRREYQFSKTCQTSSIAKASPCGQDGRLRDLVVQAALKVVLDPVFAPAVPSGHEPEKNVQWVARTIEHGLSRVYVENLEACSEAVQDKLLVEAVGRWVADAEFVALFERTLRSSPEPSQRAFLAPVLGNIALERIDAILEEAKVIGRHEAAVNVNCARFGDELIVLVSADSQYDWVLPAIKSRLRAAWAKLEVAIDPDKTQAVDMGKGETLTLLGFEFRYFAHRRDGPCVVTKRLKAPEHYDLRLGKLAQWFLYPLKYAACAVGRLVPSFRWRRSKPSPTPLPSPWQETWKSLGTALASDWRALPLLLFFSARYLVKLICRRWELAGLALCGVWATVLFWQYFSELPSETPVPKDLPGFYTGSYHSSFDPKPVEYGLYMPPRFQRAAGPHPLVVFLYNSGHPNKLLQEGLAPAIRGRLRMGADFEFAVFFAPAGLWIRPKKAPALTETLDYVMEHHRIDPNRVYLIGQARGGGELWDVAAQYPSKWAALVTVGSAWTPHAGQVPRIPCWVFQSKADAEPAVTDARDFARALQQRGGEAIYTEYKANQDIGQEVYANPKLFAWLAQKSRP